MELTCFQEETEVRVVISETRLATKTFKSEVRIFNQANTIVESVKNTGGISSMIRRLRKA